jgi:phage terminase large subunit
MITGELFQKIDTTKEKIIICQGGGDAGKTSDILKWIAKKLSENPGWVATIIGQDGPNIKKGCLRMFQRYVLKNFRRQIKSYNKTDKVYDWWNGSILEFTSFEDEQDARGAERDIAFFNEANIFSYDLFWQVQRKTRYKVLLDYNPTTKFWAHEKLIEQKEKQFVGKVKRYITYHIHNPFLSDEEHEAYENISDQELFKVYSRGRTGRVKGLIFISNEHEFPADCERIIWGVDYGYTNDPNALVKIGIKGQNRYLHECLYETVATDDIFAGRGDEEKSRSIAEIIKRNLIENGWNPEQPLYSEHDARIMYELVNIGVPVYKAWKKNKVSNIDKVKSYNLYHTKESVNYKKEVDGYKWASAININTGEEFTTNKPIDGNDHAIDAKIYAIVTDAILMSM